MAEVDPVTAKFNEIAHHEQVAHMLTVQTPPWDIAASNDIMPAQQRHMSNEGARIVCSSLLDQAQRADILFAPTFGTVVTTARWQTDHAMPMATNNTAAMISDAAYLVAHYPNPGNVLQLHVYMEHAAEKRDDRTQHLNFVAAARVMRQALSESTVNTLLAYAEASLSLRHRKAAFESVLTTVYGDRYDVWKKIPNLA